MKPARDSGSAHRSGHTRLRVEDLKTKAGSFLKRGRRRIQTMPNEHFSSGQKHGFAGIAGLYKIASFPPPRGSLRKIDHFYGRCGTAAGVPSGDHVPLMGDGLPVFVNFDQAGGWATVRARFSGRIQELPMILGRHCPLGISEGPKYIEAPSHAGEGTE